MRVVAEMRTTKKTIRQRFVDVTKKNFSNVANVCEVFFNQESFEARRLAELAAVANTLLSFLLLAKMGLWTGIYDPEWDRVLLDCTFVIFCGVGGVFSQEVLFRTVSGDSNPSL